MAKTKEQIIAAAQVVKQEVQVGANTAARVGGILEDLANANSVAVIPVTATPSGDNIVFDENPFAQIRTAHEAGQHVIVRVSSSGDVLDIAVNFLTAALGAPSYFGEVEFLTSRFVLIVSENQAYVERTDRG